MPRERAVSEVKEPHLISLKVLRLSRPSLAEQHVIPLDNLAEQTPELHFASQQSHAYPSHPADNPFILSPLLTFPPAFGSVFIGECFSCCLSANNEVNSVMKDVRVSAEMQTPSQTLNLELDGDQTTDLDPGASVQKIVNYDLKEEGNHVLAVTVTYTEPKKHASGEDDTVPSRVRTFRKLYQFVAQHCILVRTKTGPLPDGNAILEAQLENMSEGPVFLESVKVGVKGGWKTTSMNWDMEEEDSNDIPLLRSRDVMQVAFLLTRSLDVGATEEKKDEGTEVDKNAIGQLLLGWRSSCGDRGILRTGKLALAV
ncbi:hypothetical protein EDC01DRAFT_618402 [Geopyxis carbonaria]|nr:hypothetical protein EDC01DRAFT_618402 [Geopyxis carbonaria]